MAARGVLHTIEGGKVGFWCPGCKGVHVVGITTGQCDWKFNGNYDAPTFAPSILVTGKDFTPHGRAVYDAWCKAGYITPPPPFESAPTRCHSFVRNGMIQFLGDCTHALANTTVKLEAY